jgi:2-iminobutanoate/2-iminopropanoate deaminase
MSCCCEKKVIKVENGPKAIGPYSVGIQASHFIFTAGQIGLDPATGNIVEGGIEAETKQTLLNVKAILEAAGASLADVVKATVFLRDINDFNRMNAVYGTFFSENPPARSAFQVAALPRGAAIEIETIAMAPCKENGGDCCCSEK